MKRSPLARFVGVVAAGAAVLVVAAWTGIGAPALQAQPVGEGTLDGGRTGYLVVWIDNTGALPVEIDRVAWRSDGLTGTEVMVGDADVAPDGARPFEPFTLDGGERRALVLRGAISCPLPGTVVTVGAEPLRIQATPAAGPGRTLRIDLDRPGQGMARTLPCPAR